MVKEIPLGPLFFLSRQQQTYLTLRYIQIVMERLDSIADEIESVLDEKDAVREVALKSSRSVVRLCGESIRSLHKGKDSPDLIDAAMEELQKLVGITRDFPDVKHSGFVESAMQEYVEARTFQAILAGEEIPTPEKLNVTPEAYILGIGDLIGEIPENALGSRVHASIDGIVASVGESVIIKQ